VIRRDWPFCTKMGGPGYWPLATTVPKGRWGNHGMLNKKDGELLVKPSGARSALATFRVTSLTELLVTAAPMAAWTKARKVRCFILSLQLKRTISQCNWCDGVCLFHASFYTILVCFRRVPWVCRVGYSRRYVWNAVRMEDVFSVRYSRKENQKNTIFRYQWLWVASAWEIVP